MITSDRKNYTFKVYQKNKIVVRLSTHSVRRFLNHLRTINLSEGLEKAYLRVSYGRSSDVSGVSTDYNDGFYEKLEDLFRAFDAFDEIKSKEDYVKASN